MSRWLRALLFSGALLLSSVTLSGLTGAAGSPWALSTISYSNSVTVNSLDESRELSYNPQYLMQLGLSPNYRFGQVGLLSANVTLLRELTNADDTTRRGEVQATDTTVNFRGRPWSVGNGVSTVWGTTLILPTSPWSQAQTMRAGLGALGQLRWAAGSWLFVGYQYAFQRRFYEYTTGETESPRVGECAFSAAGCEAFLNTGFRNAMWVSTHALFAASNPLPWLSVSGSVAMIQRHLYPEVDDARVSFQPQAPSSDRHIVSYALEVAAQPHSTFEVALQANTFNPQLRPGGGYYAPFFNRFTALAVQLRYRPANTLSRTEALQQN